MTESEQCSPKINSFAMADPETAWLALFFISLGTKQKSCLETKLKLERCQLLLFHGVFQSVALGKTHCTAGNHPLVLATGLLIPAREGGKEGGLGSMLWRSVHRQGWAPDALCPCSSVV